MGSIKVSFFSFSRAEILVLGTGARLERINPSVLALLKKKGIAVEVQDTVKFFRVVENNFLQDRKSFATELNFPQFVQPNACATFNFLTAERRVAAAGLIPPAISTALDLTNI